MHIKNCWFFSARSEMESIAQMAALQNLETFFRRTLIQRVKVALEIARENGNILTDDRLENTDDELRKFVDKNLTYDSGTKVLQAKFRDINAVNPGRILIERSGYVLSNLTQPSLRRARSSLRGTTLELTSLQ